MAWDKAFLEGLQTGAELGFKRWQTKQENDPETLKQKAKAQMLGILAAYGQSPNTEQLDESSNNVKTPIDFNNIDTSKYAVPGIGSDRVGFMLSGSLKNPSWKVDPVSQMYMDVNKKFLEKNIENSMATQSTITGTKRFMQQFGKSYSELKNMFPEIGDAGYTGWATRKGAKISNYFDNLPETKAFQVELLPLANQMARDIEGGKITDQDRKIYADSFANTLNNPSATNVRLTANKLIGLKDKGGNITSVVKELYNSDIDFMQNVANEVLKEYPDMMGEVLDIPDGYEVVNE